MSRNTFILKYLVPRHKKREDEVLSPIFAKTGRAYAKSKIRAIS